MGVLEFPLAGPDLLDPSLDSPSVTRNFLAPPSLTGYLLAHQEGARYVLAARFGSIAAPVMLATGRAVLTYGGYLGADRILTVPQMAQLVRKRQVRFFWMLNAQAEQGHAATSRGG